MKPQESLIRILFVGDMMFDRDIRRIGERGGYHSLLGEAYEHMSSYDIVVGNLEGPITNFASVSLGSAIGTPENTRFTFSSDIIDALKNFNFIAHIGNNHIWDYGRAGLEETKRALMSAQLPYFGDIRGAQRIVHSEMIQGKRIVFVSYNEFLGDGYMRVLEAIQNEKSAADFLAVYAHWGDEYNPQIPSRIQNVAEAFIEAGADIVVGSHPHVVGEILKMNEKTVYYSLGNFIFDQYWDRSVRCGAVLEVVLDPRTNTYTEALIQTAFADGRVVWDTCR